MPGLRREEVAMLAGVSLDYYTRLERGNIRGASDSVLGARAGHDVHEHRTGVKTFHHPEVGRIAVAFDVFGMPGEAGLMIVTYSPPPNTDSADKFALLAGWAATIVAGEGTPTAGDNRPLSVPLSD